jgi:transcription termination factor Rho
VTELATRQHTSTGNRGPRRSTRKPTGQSAHQPARTGNETTIAVSGLIDIQKDQGFVRLNGYLPGSDDPAVPTAHLERHGLRRGDLITGSISVTSGQRRRGTLVAVETVNGVPADQLGSRPDFYQQTPLHPQERMRLETEPHILTTRLIDLLAPIGKGQRALIVSPPKAGKTTVMQQIAHAISVNHPDSHLMAVLIDERPEEVTDMQRTVRGEVISSTFDMPPSHHTAVAELAIERAKRLVEQGRDVVVMLDSITRLGRAYNLAAPAGGRIMSGGIEVGALIGPKRILGAARNLENGGSLTIIATALVETGSTGDTVIFEEFKGTGNSELRLMRAMADRRVFPAVDIDSSGTRKEELLLDPEEADLVRRLRRALQSQDPQQNVEQLLDNLRKTSSNAEFLMNVARSAASQRR